MQILNLPASTWHIPVAASLSGSPSVAVSLLQNVKKTHRLFLLFFAPDEKSTDSN